MSTGKPFRFACFGVALLAAFMSFRSTLSGQTATGSISGVVEDESGAVIPGATITVNNIDTGIGRSVVTDAGGRYHVPGLIPDHYEVQAQMPGFETAVRKGIQLTVGSNLEIKMLLRVGQVAEKTVVTAEAPLVETLTGTVSGLVDDRAIRDLPLNGRSFDQLISLQSSSPVIRFASGSQNNVGATNYTVNGARGNANMYLMDGTELIGAGAATTLPGGALGNNPGVDAIREFTVLTSNYSAAYGKRAGGIINMATRSGTNEIHGSAFEFLRNSALDARDFFNVQNAPFPSPLPPFKRNEFGGSLGGPISRDRAFFFTTYDGLRQRLGQNSVETVPDDNARAGLLPRLGQLVNFGVAPSVKPFMILFPPVNGRTFGDGTAESINNPNLVSNQDFFLERADYKLSDKDFVFVRYNFTQADQFTESPQLIVFADTVHTTGHVLTIEETRTYPRTLNTLRFGLTRSTNVSNNRPTVPVDSSLGFLPGAKTIGQITFGIGTTSNSAPLTSQGSNGNDRHFSLNQFDVSDQVFHEMGAHALQFGIQTQRFQSNGDFGGGKSGVFQFADFQSFLLGQAATFQAASPSGSGDATKAYRQTYVGAYVQDDYKLKRNLTLNLGLRYEFMTPPTEASGDRISNYRSEFTDGFWTVPTKPVLGSPFYASRKLNFAPRFGFAWDVAGDGMTAVRGGFGMFYDQIQSEYRFFTAQNDPFFSLTEVRNPPFPLGFSSGLGTNSSAVPDGILFDMNVPTRIQYNLNIQRQVTPNIALNVGYVGSHSYHLTYQSDLNTVRPQFLPGRVVSFAANAPRINPAVSSSRIVGSDANGLYNGLQLDVMRRLSRGLRAKASFTWSKNIDDASTLVSAQSRGNPNATENPFDREMDRGLSGFDVRRNLAMNFTYNLPWASANGLAARLVGGWQIGGIVTLSDGMPFTIVTGFNRSLDKSNTAADRPNLKAGFSNNPVLGGPDRYYDPNAFELPPAGFFGNLARNTMIAPGFFTTDATLVKTTPLSERVKMDFRAEFFNITNRANFNFPSTSIFSSNGQIRGAAGRINSTISPARQIQFALKLSF